MILTKAVNTGHGSFGVIRKVRRKVDGMILCRKEISYLKMSQKEREQLHAEFQILSTLRHPNIVGYYHREHLKATQDLHLYMEYCGNGDLGRVIRDLQQKNQYAEEPFVWSIFAQLVTALFRCHYGVDPPEVGKHVLGLGATAKPKAPTGGMVILHRDLKPENVFLGADNSVKLGDFGLSKMIQSHDFASTYVGTPFYMSPEICAAEKYTLKSDIWSLGCIIYELCTREPPFNAKSHFQLVQKIKEGKIAPLPSVYSAELTAVIKDCLRVNPDRRPDTAALLNLPVVRLMRKEKEVVDMSRVLKTKEEALEKRIRELDQKISSVDADKAYIRQEIDSSLRREWEVKARLEIDRLVNTEIEQLKKKFDQEVQARVELELQQQKKTVTFNEEELEPQDFSSSVTKSDYPFSSIGAGSADGEFPSTTDITELSVDSPDTSAHEVKKPTRTPFGRAQTMFAGTPMDIEMASPSPIAIASLSLSPRRTAATKAPNAHQPNIFTMPGAVAGDPRWEATRDGPGLGSDSDSEDEVVIPSPTRMIKSSKNPFSSKTRPQLSHMKTAPVNRLKSQPSLPAPSKTTGAIPTIGSSQDLRQERSNGALRERCTSPNRRLSKIPSAASLAPNGAVDTTPQGLTRKPSFTKKDFEPPSSGLVSKAAPKNNIKGRTLVELQQARAGGRPLSAVMGAENNVSPKRAFKEHVVATHRGAASEPAAIWDPEHDEMPSPFLVRRKPIARV
ncbi:putative g2-specific protein kinase nima protein [Phaeoacremonium minimum UCRPA7]|uniref:non-specific serine/threonine protein kinase n=1 Tax=Phaeoacremonium minimum (strain UCR-PA7) TaxID=1286976 RepID=R8BHP1_PHAM7|nr:putative g2-specific protein kinase nima protein [Phaeoacremonium minimum UCRPA7]EON98782.1 putative g2-specific protein kinase nima protein [Phaeoacremonium minimum UCRPA7]